MRGYSRAVAQSIPLVSLSAVSCVALRLFSWAAPRVLTGKSDNTSDLSTGSVFAGRLQYPAGTSVRLIPWAHAVPLEVPVPQHRPLRAMPDVNNRDIDVADPTSALLWKDCQREAMRSLHHPWTIGLATGNTSRSSFKRYVAQDAYFLKAFAKAYAYALIKAEDEDGIHAFHSLIGSVLEEMRLHASYAKKWGIDIQNVPPPVNATAQYVEFLHAVASNPASSVAEVLASMAPCMRLYAFLGKELRGAFPRWKESAYAEWIETYSSKEFEEAAALVETLLDTYSADVEYPPLLDLYSKAMQLEYHFFAAQGQETAEDDRPGHVAHTDAIGGESTGSTARVVDTEGRGRFRGVHERVALFCVDFDDTLTDGDTTGLLVETAKAQRKNKADQEAMEHEWAALTKAFLDNWRAATEECLAGKLPHGACAAEPSAHVDREGLEKMLQNLAKVDLESVLRVSESKVLGGITREGVHASLAGPLKSSWRVRPGMTQCFSRALASPFETHVVSINWSRDVIAEILSASLHADSGLSSDITSNMADDVSAGKGSLVNFGDDQPVRISSNDLLYDEHGASTGEIAMHVSGSFGKHQQFLDLATAAREQRSEKGTASKSLTVYVGDSVTDLLAMLDADVGIVVGDSATFTQVASAFSIPIRPLASAYEELSMEGESSEARLVGRGRCIYRARWAEIDAFLFGEG